MFAGGRRQCVGMVDDAIGGERTSTFVSNDRSWWEGNRALVMGGRAPEGRLSVAAAAAAERKPQGKL